MLSIREGKYSFCIKQITVFQYRLNYQNKHFLKSFFLNLLWEGV